MAEWTNIFELGEWDLFVQFVGVTEAGDPDWRDYLIPIDMLPAEIGAVTVVDGVIVCNFEESGSGSGGNQPQIVALPATGNVLPSSAGRVLTLSSDGLNSSEFEVGEAYGVEQMGGPNELGLTASPDTNFVNLNSVPDAIAALPIQLPQVVGSGHGFYAFNYSRGV